MRKRKPVQDHPELLGLPEVRMLWQTEGLFSDHYLKAHLRKNAWWPGDNEARRVWEFCQQLYEKRYLACARNNEAFTRQELIDKILEKLDFPYTVNLGLPETEQDLRSNMQHFLHRVAQLPGHILSYFEHPCINYAFEPV